MKSRKKKKTKFESEVPNIKKDWKNCLPGNLSNLFYYTNAEGLHRYNNYFTLGEDGITKLLELRTAVNSIRIYMGCTDNKFSPLLAIVSGPTDKPVEDYYELTYSPITGTNNHSPFPILDEITPGIASLFQKNWEELSDSELADAFSGVTVNNIKKQSTEPRMTQRVNSYDFPKEDVEKIIKSLNEVGENSRYLHLLLGAGLTVRLTHPFNFRPILAVPSLTEAIPSADNDEIVFPEAYFERSQPCPPYCPTGSGNGG